MTEPSPPPSNAISTVSTPGPSLPPTGLESRLVRAAGVCGGVPLVAGVGIFVAWLVTGEDRLMDAGWITILVGTGLVALGLLLLIVHSLVRPRAAGPSALPVERTSLLLLSNFPAAFAIVIAASKVDSCHTLELVNESGVAVEDVILRGDGVGLQLSSLAAGEEDSGWFWAHPVRDSTAAVELSATIDGSPYSWSLGAVNPNHGERMRVRLRPDRGVEVQGGTLSFRVSAEGEWERTSPRRDRRALCARLQALESGLESRPATGR